MINLGINSFKMNSDIELAPFMLLLISCMLLFVNRIIEEKPMSSNVPSFFVRSFECLPCGVQL